MARLLYTALRALCALRYNGGDPNHDNTKNLPNKCSGIAFQRILNFCRDFLAERTVRGARCALARCREVRAVQPIDCAACGLARSREVARGRIKG
ncbi:hypothetical protein LMG29542_01205 [Paraburkholderia humisilvae]|uniref:Uncharacterized protein n=1 Tax=Paraburkholderia humisilvae TaxID=627669 RepID=A0A6J5D6W5_9BURK|nr:hypothetical protein LMG29542_01205 [Paraburkholderia humisilvae]